MLRRALVGIVLAISTSTALATDPLTLILLRMLRDKVITDAAEAMYDRLTAPQPQGPVVVPMYPYDFDDASLRAIIDGGFVYLSAAQREEVFASVRRILADPRYANVRLQIIEELRVKASAVRQAHDALSRLSQHHKRSIAAEVREEYVKLDAAERQELFTALQSGVVPIPRDLSDMILAEFRSVR